MTNGSGEPGRPGRRAALITGGTRGVGLAVARRLCAAGYDTHLVYRQDREAAEAALKSLANLSAAAYLIEADLTEAHAMDQVLAGVGDRSGRLDVLVSSAADPHHGPASQAAADAWADLTLALQPLLYGIPEVARMMAGGPGRIVAVSSLGARRVVDRYASQGIAKAALEALVRYLAVELAPQGITVNAVSTSKIDTGAPGEPPGLVQALARRTPAGRLTRPEDVADVVSLLCRPEAGWIHGQVITADGGLSLVA